MELVARVQGILFKPKEEWAKIKDETTTVSQLFTSYAAILAAIPAIAQFIRSGLIGYRVPYFGWMRWGIGTAFFRSVLFYIFALISVFLIGLIINLLAPSFSSKQDNVNAMKLAVFSMTPSWVAGILYFVPVLSLLVFIAGLYGIYLLYLGFATPLMDTPKEKVVPYMIVSIIVVIVMMFVVSLILGAIFTVGTVYRAI